MSTNYRSDQEDLPFSCSCETPGCSHLRQNPRLHFHRTQGCFTLKLKWKKSSFCSYLCYSTLAERGWGQPSMSKCSGTMALHWESTETVHSGKLVLPPCFVRSVQLFAVLFPVYKPWESSTSVWWIWKSWPQPGSSPCPCIPLWCCLKPSVSPGGLSWDREQSKSFSRSWL